LTVAGIIGIYSWSNSNKQHNRILELTVAKVIGSLALKVVGVIGRCVVSGRMEPCSHISRKWHQQNIEY